MALHKKYVFVVCGDAIHIETLHFSLKMLQAFTVYDIIIITDTRRNTLPIQHNNIIDVKTPSEFTHHQAAIYLKTSLHRILPKNNIYCYLDTDVVAIRSGIDTIFDYYDAPITFCTDHCKIKAFSPNAVNDPFYDDLLTKQAHLSELYFKYQQAEEQQKINAGAHLDKIQQLKMLFNKKRPAHALAMRSKNIIKVLTAKIIFWVINSIAWLFTFLKISKLNHAELLERMHRFIFKSPLNFNLFLQEYGYYFDILEQKWYNLGGELLYEENLVVKRIEKESVFRWDVKAQVWRDEAGNDISNIESDKLIHLIYNKFGVIITNTAWRHWNGGVFLFDASSYDFMEQWHQWTLEIFKDQEWKTRDQGTLIATAWKFNLQHHPTLPIHYNFIADFYHPNLFYKGNFQFYIDKNKSIIDPFFLHIYHHWEDSSWQLWQDVKELHEKLISHNKESQRSS